MNVSYLYFYLLLKYWLVFSLVSCVAAVQGIREAMKALKETGTDFKSAKGMDPMSFFQVMGEITPR